MDQSITRRGRIIIVGSIIILLIVLVRMSYALFTKELNGTNNIVNTGDISFSYNEPSSSVSLVNSLPTSDISAKYRNDNYFEFTLSSSASGTTDLNYIIYTILDSNNTLDSKYVKIYLTKTGGPAGAEIEVVPPSLMSSFTDDIYNNNSVIYKNSINLNNNSYSETFRLRMWVDSSYEGSSSSMNFKLKLNVFSSKGAIDTRPYTNPQCFILNGSTIIDYKCYSGNPYGMPVITDIFFPPTINVVNITTIGLTQDERPIIHDGFTSLIIPEGITTISNSALSSSSLNGMTITIPSTVTSIGYSALDALTGKSVVKIINKTNKSFNWLDIIGGVGTYNAVTAETTITNGKTANECFTTGTVTNWGKTVLITSE